MKAFLRRNAKMHLKLGRKRKKKLRWHRPKGRDNKMREKRKGRPKTVSVGYGKQTKKDFGKEIFVMNEKDLNGLKKGAEVMLRHIGKRNKVEVAKKAQEKGIVIKNLNMKKFLKMHAKKKQGDEKK